MRLYMPWFQFVVIFSMIAAVAVILVIVQVADGVPFWVAVVAASVPNAVQTALQLQSLRKMRRASRWGSGQMGAVVLISLVALGATGCSMTVYDQTGRAVGTRSWPANGGTSIAIANASAFAMQARVVGLSCHGDRGPGVNELIPAGGMAEFFFANSVGIVRDRASITIAVTFLDHAGRVVGTDEVRTHARTRSGEYRSDMVTVGRHLRKR